MQGLGLIVNIRIFGKSEVNGHRRLGVLLARDISVEKALEKSGTRLREVGCENYKVCLT